LREIIPKIIRKVITKGSPNGSSPKIANERYGTRPQKNVAGLIRNAVIKGLQEYLACTANPEALFVAKPWLRYIHEIVIAKLTGAEYQSLLEFNRVYNEQKKAWVHHKSWNKLFDLMKISEGGIHFLALIEAFLGEAGEAHYTFWIENGGGQQELKGFLKSNKGKIKASLKTFKEKSF
jgi:hypothetical protein